MGLTQYFYNFLQLLKIGEDNNGNLTYGGNALPVNAGGVTIFKQSTPPTDVPLGTIWLDDSGTVRFNPTIAAIAPQAFLYTAGLTVAVNISDVQDVNECYLSVISSDSAAVPTTGITFAGSGNNRTMHLPPLSASGSAVLTVIVTDPYGLTAQTAISVVAGATIFTVSTSAAANGSISPAGNIPVVQGGDYTFVASPSTGYYVQQLVVDGVPITGTTQYTFNNVQGNHTISAVFTVNTAPTISNIADQSTTYQTVTGAILFTIGDAETSASSLIVTKSSSNQTLVPDANIVLGGSGANRTVTVTSANGQAGTAVITITVSDGDKQTVSTFTLTVAPAIPTGLVALNPSVGLVNLAWNAAGGADNYDVKYGTTTGDYTTILSNIGNVTSLDVSGLTNATYYFVVVAKKGSVASTSSSEVSSDTDGPLVNQNFDALTIGTGSPSPFSANAGTTSATIQAMPVDKGTGNGLEVVYVSGGEAIEHCIFAQDVISGHAEFGVAFNANAGRYIAVSPDGKDVSNADVLTSVFMNIYSFTAINNAPVSLKINGGASGGQFQISAAGVTDDFSVLNEFKIEWDLTTPSAPIWNFYKKVAGVWILMTKPAISLPTALVKVNQLTMHVGSSALSNSPYFDYFKVVKVS